MEDDGRPSGNEPEDLAAGEVELDKACRRGGCGLGSGNNSCVGSRSASVCVCVPERVSERVSSGITPRSKKLLIAASSDCISFERAAAAAANSSCRRMCAASRLHSLSLSLSPSISIPPSIPPSPPRPSAGAAPLP